MRRSARAAVGVTFDCVISFGSRLCYIPTALECVIVLPLRVSFFKVILYFVESGGDLAERKMWIALTIIVVYVALPGGRMI